jgi:hypothetical protein
MEFHAAGASDSLDKSWERPKRHNRHLERAALWFMVGLEEDCGTVLETIQGDPLLLSPSTDVATRYELQAGMRTVSAMFPFTGFERMALRHDVKQGNTQFDDENAIGEPELVDRWHEWLWMDEHGQPQPRIEALGASAVLAEGCARLRRILPTIL